jgi:dienelactone hydrolase
MTKCLIVLLAFVLIGYAPAYAQEPKPSMSPDIMATADTFVELLVKRDFTAVETYFDDKVKTALPAEKLEQLWNRLNGQVGSFKRKVATRREDSGKFATVIVTCEFEKASLDVRMGFDNAGRIAGLNFAPAATAFEYTPPGYVNPNAFSEKEVTVGTGEWALPGTLSIPVGRGPFPAVVLVHGSGPGDRDETVGRNKPFRDLAWGLASQGVAVLRYEKRTRQYGAKLASVIGHFTVKEETIDDALAAVTLLRATAGIYPKKIFVLGHSLGGTLIPRIGKLDPRIAGFIVMAGLVKPMEDAFLEQTTYIVSLDGTISAEEQARLDEIKKQVAAVKSLTPSDINSPVRLLFAPVSYWLDLRGYDPAATAKMLKQRMLILQGERDYQVTMDDFQQWKTALSSRKNVTFKSYPALNHLFIPGNGKSQPAEYDIAGHVEEDVVNDIANWIKK